MYKNNSGLTIKSSIVELNKSLFLIEKLVIQNPLPFLH